MKKILFLFMLVLFITSCDKGTNALFTPANEKVPSSDIENTLTQSPDSIRVIDVRPMEEFQDGHLPHAISLPYDDGHFDSMYQRLDWDKNMLIVVVDNYEHRSVDAAKKLTASGFLNVKVLKGGFSAWKMQNYQIEK